MKEGEFVTSDQLKNEWTNVLGIYNLFIDGGHKLRPISFIIRHIMEKGYDKFLFPTTSMYSLRISIPYEHKVNFNKTLRIDFDHLKEKLKFRFRDRTTQIEWSDTCYPTEGTDLLENFFAENEDFGQAIKTQPG